MLAKIFCLRFRLAPTSMFIFRVVSSVNIRYAIIRAKDTTTVSAYCAIPILAVDRWQCMIWLSRVTSFASVRPGIIFSWRLLNGTSCSPVALVSPLILDAWPKCFPGTTAISPFITVAGQRIGWRLPDISLRRLFAIVFVFDLDDETGKPRPALEKVFAHESHWTHLYVCGPTGFIKWVVDAAKAAGWTRERIHYEYFSPPVAAPNAECFEIELARSGGIFTVPAEKSVVAVLRENGIDLPVSCEAGVCGTCLTRVLAGDPDHRDVYLTDEEHARNDRFTPCCSRSLSRRLVLDL